MRKTPFAGLTELEPGEPLNTDGGAVVTQNPTTIDRFLELGAVSHRHNARPAIDNPTVQPSGSAVASGGLLPPDFSCFMGYTVFDELGGETLMTEPVLLSTPAAMEEPVASPSAVMGYTAGGLMNGIYYYAITLTDDEGGETTVGPYAEVERVPGYASAQAELSGFSAIVASAGAAGWRLYRSKNGGRYRYLTSGTAADDTYTDDSTECLDCDEPPDENTTNGNNTFLLTFPPSGSFPSGASAFSLYVSVGGDFLSPALYETYPMASAGETVTLPDLYVSDGRPPDVSTAVRGASLIDPDTELIDWHWKRPVLTSAALPSGEPGDLRFVIDANTIYAVQGSAAVPDNTGWDVLREIQDSNFYRVKANGSASGFVTPVTDLDFTASGATVEVIEDGAGSARVHIGVEFPDPEQELMLVEGDGSGSAVGPIGTLIFVGSGGASAVVTGSGGSATVTIIAGSEGGGGGSIYFADAVEDLATLEAIVPEENGEARVVMYDDSTSEPALYVADKWGEGPADFAWHRTMDNSGGTLRVAAHSGIMLPENGSSGSVVRAAPGFEELIFRGSGAAVVTVGSGGTGESQTHPEVTIFVAPSAGGSGTTYEPPVREELVASAAALASAGTLAVDLTAYAGWRLLRVEASRACRVQVYPNDTYRDADAARGIGTDPTLDHGVLLDLVLPAGDLDYAMAPPVHGYNLDDPVDDVAYLRLTNMAALGDVVVTLTLVQTE